MASCVCRVCRVCRVCVRARRQSTCILTVLAPQSYFYKKHWIRAKRRALERTLLVGNTACWRHGATMPYVGKFHLYYYLYHWLLFSLIIIICLASSAFRGAAKVRSARRAFVEAILLFSIFALLSKLKLHDQSFLILYLTDLCLRLYLQWCQVGAAGAYGYLTMRYVICTTKNRCQKYKECTCSDRSSCEVCGGWSLEGEVLTNQALCET